MAAWSPVDAVGGCVDMSDLEVGRIETDARSPHVEIGERCQGTSGEAARTGAGRRGAIGGRSLRARSVALAARRESQRARKADRYSPVDAVGGCVDMSD